MSRANTIQKMIHLIWKMQERGLWLKYARAEATPKTVGSIRAVNQSTFTASKSADRSKLVPAGKPSKKEQEEVKSGRKRVHGSHNQSKQSSTGNNSIDLKGSQPNISQLTK